MLAIYPGYRGKHYHCAGCDCEYVPMGGMQCFPCAESGVKAWVLSRDAERKRKEMARLQSQNARAFKARMTKKRR